MLGSILANKAAMHFKMVHNVRIVSLSLMGHQYFERDPRKKRLLDLMRALGPVRYVMI